MFLYTKNYNKYVYNQPYPSGYTTQQIKIANHARYHQRLWFAGFIAPMLLFGGLILRKEIVDVNIGTRTSEKVK